MCLQPVKLPNNYFGSQNFYHMVSKDVDKKYILVPCGHCPECIAMKQGQYAQRMEIESKYNHFFFATLTYDNKHLPTLAVDIPVFTQKAKDEVGKKDPTLFDFDAEEFLKGTKDIQDLGPATDADVDKYLMDNGYIDSYKTIEIRYADIHHLQLLFKRMRDNNTLGRPFRYLAVSERGKKNGRPHFHILFLVPKQEDDNYNTCIDLQEKLKSMLLEYWAVNVGTRKHPVYERLFTYRQRWYNGKLYRNFDCHYVNPATGTDGTNSVVYYVTKYIFKDSDKERRLQQLLNMNLPTEEYIDIWNFVKSRMISSKGIGLDGVLEPKVVTEKVLRPLYEYAEEMKALLNEEDLPADDAVLPSSHIVLTRKTRVLVPNPEVVQEVKLNSTKHADTGQLVYIPIIGKHVPLCRYLKRHCCDVDDFATVYYSATAESLAALENKMEPEMVQYLDGMRKYEKQLAHVEDNEIDGMLDSVTELGVDVDPFSPYRSTYKLVFNDSPKILLGK